MTFNIINKSKFNNNDLKFNSNFKNHVTFDLITLLYFYYFIIFNLLDWIIKHLINSDLRALASSGVALSQKKPLDLWGVY